MTPEQLRTTGEALIALSEGKATQYSNDCGKTWKDRCYTTVEHMGASVHHTMTPWWRIKPALVKRLMRADEFPNLWWFRLLDQNVWYLNSAMKCDGSGFSVAGCHLKFEDAKDHWQWSPDRKQINSFFVEEA